VFVLYYLYRSYGAEALGSGEERNKVTEKATPHRKRSSQAKTLHNCRPCINWNPSIVGWVCIPDNQKAL